jgi:hypothetical protein
MRCNKVQINKLPPSSRRRVVVMCGVTQIRKEKVEGNAVIKECK